MTYAKFCVRPPSSSLPSGRGKFFFTFTWRPARCAYPARAHILRVYCSTRMPHPRVCAASHPPRPALLLCPFGSREVLLLLLHGAPRDAHILRVHILRAQLGCACRIRACVLHRIRCVRPFPLPFGSREVLLFYRRPARCAYPARAHILRVHSSDAHTHPRVCAASQPLRPPFFCPFGSREVLLLLLHGAHAMRISCRTYPACAQLGRACRDLIARHLSRVEAPRSGHIEILRPRKFFFASTQILGHH